MKVSSLCALVGVAARASAYSNLDVREAEDELEKWLSAVQAQPLEALKSCPISCSTAGDDSWFLFPDASRLSSCNETMLLDIAVQSPFVPDSSKASLCVTANKVLEEGSIRIYQSGNGGEYLVDHFLSAGCQIKSYLASEKPSCSNNAMAFGYSQSTVIGLFAGAEQTLRNPDTGTQRVQ
ncbi:hypothetical protein BKA61DRAFT_682455 [Leptodontidium sp. MPI-SDFR-AT-0119]|nr:hypothetical protein BKA61DRAFT_682455 [Leptodontidium sp. MPI-SDFR-AT-0119]